MKQLQRGWVVLPAIVLVVLLVFLVVGRNAMQQLAFLQRGQGSGETLVDQTPYETAQTLAALAVSSEEQTLAQQAEKLADHEVDQAFASALRRASLQPKVLTGSALETQQKIAELQALVKDDQARVDALDAAAKKSGAAASEGDDLDVAKAQLGLDSDELTDAQGDLAAESGDLRGKIQQELAAREAAMKKAEDAAAGKKETAVVTARQDGTLQGRASAWFDQRSRATLVAQGADQARADIAALQKQHDGFEKKSAAEGAAGSALAGRERVKLLQSMASQRVLMSILDDRVATNQQLAAVYDRWQKQIWTQHRIVRYLLLQSFAWLAFVVLLASLGAIAGRMAVRKVATDYRRIRTLDTIVMLAVEIFALVTIALIIWGLPQQIPTILGFATAGLTVVFQDFIIAFFGWFALMGKNGIRVGDWVEINSVSGEVAEIGLFRTVLLETGNWTTKGHPTGRRMGFSNSFALRGQFFNFSTNGQWMWDEISLNVPATANAYELIKQMQTAVDRETDDDTDQAQAEWERVAKDIGVGQFSAKPTVELRPAAAGVDVVVRFVTRASDRFNIRSKINAAMLDLMEGTGRPNALEAPPAA